MKYLLVLVVLFGSAVATACGGGGGGSPDQEQLDRIRSEFTSTSLASEEDVIAALGIAERSAGDPLGENAFELAQEIFLDSYVLFDADGGLGSRAPGPPAELMLMPGDVEFDQYRLLAGFVSATPGAYDPAAARGRFRDYLVENDVSFYLFRLDEALANRQLWVSDLETAGETSRSFTVADFAPPTVETRLEGETIVTLYSAEAVAAAGEHTRQLIAAIATARAAFPTVE